MSDARILDRGYREYDGHRSGVPGAVRSVTRHTVRSILGLGRAGRHKVFPIIVGVIAFVPSVVFMAVTVLFGAFADEVRPEYWEFFGFSKVAALVFAAFVAPEAIVRDRRDGMYAMYLSTPLTRPTYLVAKAFAVVGTMWLIVGAPVTMAFVGYTAQNQGPDGFPAWTGVLARLLASGLMISVVLTAIGLAAASLTDRRAFATIAVVLVLFGASIAVSTIVDQGGVDTWFRLFDPIAATFEIPPRVFGARTAELRQVGTPAVVLAVVGWFVVPTGVIALRYRRLEAV